MPETAVASPTPEAPVATPATPEPAGTSSGTVSPGSQTAEAGPSEETFFSGDPNTLPPELKQAYTNMLKDYKTKTQSIAETRKKAEAFDRVSSRSDFKDWWSGASQKQKAEFKEQKAVEEKRLGQKISDEEFTKAFSSKDDFLSFFEKAVHEVGEKSQRKIEKLEEQLSVKDAADVVDSFATEVGKDGKPVRPDFYNLDEDQLITGYLNVNPPSDKSQEAYIEKLNEAYGWAKQVSQKYYEKGKAEALQIIQKKAATSTEPPTSSSKGAYTGPDPKKMSVKEAMDLAKKGIRVPRDD